MYISKDHNKMDGNSMSDPYGEGILTSMSSAKDCFTVICGMVQAAYPFFGQYKVYSMGQMISCVDLHTSGGSGFGVSTKGSYNVGDFVVCAVNPSLGSGYILGCTPLNPGYRSIRGVISGSSDISGLANGDTRFLLNTGPDANDSQRETALMDTHLNPIDSFGCGSFSVTSGTGVTLFADPLFIMLSAGETTGVWAFSDDDYLRVAGRNFQEISGGSVRECFLDGTECTEFTGHSLFSWEVLGCTRKPDKEPAIAEDTDGIKTSGEAAWEPQERDAKPFHRVAEYGGYLGQGYQRCVLSPPESGETLRYGKENKDQHCLSRVAQFLDGTVSIESRQSILLSKRCYIPFPQQMYPLDDFEDGCGDSEKNGYDFEHAGLELHGSPELSAEKTSRIVQEIMALADYNAYLFNYKLVNAFSAHSKDYYVQEESDASVEQPKYSQWFSQLKSQMIVEDPEDKELDIHGKLKSKYYAAESGFALLPEGGVSCYGGYGEELRMAGGSLTLSAPGDIWLKAGKNIHLWAGKDIIMKAHECLDASASNGSMRFKAEKNMELLGGNAGGSFGMLLESKGSGNFDFTDAGDSAEIGGLVLRSAKGAVVAEGKDVYVRSGVDKNNPGSLILDAGQPYGNVVIAGGSVKHFVSNSFTINGGVFDSPESGEIHNTLRLSPGSSEESPGMLTLSATIYNTGSLFNKEPIYCGSSMFADGSYITTADSTMVSPMGSTQSERFRKQLDETFKLPEKMRKSEQTSYETWTKSTYAEYKYANESVLERTGFSFRTDKEYDADKFLLYEDRWQTLTGEGVNTWNEPKVETFTEDGCYSYPGDKFYKGENCLVTQPCVLYNQDTCALIDRMSDAKVSEEYKSAKYKEPELKALDHYKIIGK